MNDQAKAIFECNVVGVLATVNDDGSPWSTPIHVVADSKAAYWFSKEEAIHSQNIAEDPRVSVSLFSPDTSHGLKGVYISGEAEVLSEAGKKKAIKLFEKRLESVPPVFASWNAYKLQIGVPNLQKSTGNCWYFYS